jgi:hypothetical protein
MSLQTYNSIICEYYKDNISEFEETNILLIKLLKNLPKDKSIKDFLDTTVKFIKSIELELKTLYPGSTIISQDSFHTLLREDLPTIGIYIYDCEEEVVIQEEWISSYIDSVDVLIILSQKSDIINTKNFDLIIQNNKIISYIHNLDYEYFKLKMAINSADAIHYKLSELNVKKNGDQMWKEINKEFLILQQQKSLITNFIKEQMTVMLDNVKIMELPILSCHLNEKFKNPRMPCITCDLCNLYVSSTLKGMAAHKRGCKKKIITPVKVSTSSDPFL